MAKKVQAYIKLQVKAGMANPAPPVVDSASHKPGKEIVGKITKAQLIEIVGKKDGDMTGADIEASARSIAGTARSMGIQVED